MRFNRRITEIKAISFDLDDTLYSNRQVMLDTDAAMQGYFHHLFSQYQLPLYAFDYHFWLKYRQQVLLTEPELIHDVTEIRYRTYQLGFADLELPKKAIDEQAKLAMKCFLSHRNRVSVPAEIYSFLNDLSSRFPLVAISNGNVDTKVIKLDRYFQAIFHAGNGYKQKPAADLFKLAIKTLAIEPAQLLHVGDCGYADINGANRAGCQSAWLNCYDVGKPIRHLADIELTQVTDLAKWL